VTERGRQDEPKQTKQKKNNYVPFRFHLFLSSVIEKYSQISYLQRNEQLYFDQTDFCFRCGKDFWAAGIVVFEGRNFTSMAFLIWF